MQYVKGLEAYKETECSAVTFGKFDGLHRGHEKLVGQVREFAWQDKVKSVVCAFDMSPLWEKKGVSKELLMTKEERAFHLRDEVDYLVDCPFTEAFSQMEAEEFIEKIIKGVFHAAYVVVGTDFQFGYEKQGDIHLLQACEEKYEYELRVFEKERYEGEIISSTYIKEILKKGNMKAANKMLGYRYGCSGMVEHGKKIGRTLGFPTLNVAPPKGKIAPEKGVYICVICVDGVWHEGISNVGVKPTVSQENRMLIESYLFTYEGDAYGKEVRVKLLEFVRPEQKFSSVEEMKERISEDIAFGEKFFKQGGSCSK